jgi:hypothetical protein
VIEGKTTTPTSAWIASKVIHLLKKESNMGLKELRKRLEEKYKCEIHYDTVWKGRQLAIKELHDSWEEKFQMLFNWRAEVLSRSPGSVIKIDIKEVDGKIYFHRFFLCISPLHSRIFRRLQTVGVLGPTAHPRLPLKVF